MKTPNTLARYRMAAIVLCIITALLSSCRSKPISSEIATDSIYASMTLRSIGNGITKIEVRLSSGDQSGSNIYLVNGDMLKASANGLTQNFVEDEKWLNIIRHLATLQSDVPGTIVNISFERPGPTYESALDSTITLPADINIRSPEINDVFNFGNSINVSWEPSGISPEINIIFKITCQDDEDISSRRLNYPVSDSGASVYSVDELLDSWTLGPNLSCSAEIDLVRKAEGVISGEFTGGSITAQTESSVFITIKPVE